MRRFVRDHERLVEPLLAPGAPPERLRAFRRYHERQLDYLQAERFAHLFVMLTFGLLTALGLVAALLQPGLTTGAILLLFLVLLVPYIAHYFFLENSVQRWYGLSRELDRRLGRAPPPAPPPP